MATYFYYMSSLYTKLKLNSIQKEVSEAISMNTNFTSSTMRNSTLNLPNLTSIIQVLTNNSLPITSPEKNRALQSVEGWSVKSLLISCDNMELIVRIYILLCIVEIYNTACIVDSLYLKHHSIWILHYYTN